MTDLVEWLKAQLDADEQAAREGHIYSWHTRYCGNQPGSAMFGDCECDVPAAVLADVASKRAILDQHRFYLAGGQREQMCQTCGGEGVMSAVSWPCNTVRLLVSALAHRDGFDPTWAQLDPVDLW